MTDMTKPMTKEDLIPPYPHTADVALPDVVNKEISSLLQLASNVHAKGMEMRMCFVGLEANGEQHFVDASEVPKEMLAPWIMMLADKHEWVALIMCTEGWTLPQEIARDYRKPGGYSGQIGDHPDAIEVLMVQAETVKGTWMGQITFKGKYPEREMLEPKVLELKKADAVGGRYNNLLKANRHMKTDLLQLLAQARFYAESNGLTGEKTE